MYGKESFTAYRAVELCGLTLFSRGRRFNGSLQIVPYKPVDHLYELNLFLTGKSLKDYLKPLVLFLSDILQGPSPLLSDFEDSNPFISGIGLPDNKAALFKPLCQTGHIRTWNEHYPAHLAYPVLPVQGGIQDPQDVVLGKGKPVVPENTAMSPLEEFGGSNHGHQCLLIRTQGALIGAFCHNPALYPL